jgi:FtsP/CotA-like multicopper oxidase with cupredoxin domain
VPFLAWRLRDRQNAIVHGILQNCAGVAVHRRTFIGGVAAALVSTRFDRVSEPDIALRIAPVTIDLGHGRSFKTIGYNGTVPGPLIRLREGQQVTAAVVNDTGDPELVHWHGLHIASEVDGASEEGTPFIPPHGSARYSFTAAPSGFRWYHSHGNAGRNLSKTLYSGQFGLLYIEPRDNPGQFDQEVFLALRGWEPYLTSGETATEVAYKAYSINDRSLGAGDPLRVREGQRVLLHVINASATDVHRVALPGHHFHVIALDGNPVATPGDVDVLELGPAERVDALVEMRQPGVWILGSTDDDVRKNGMGMVIEYAGQSGAPQWTAPAADAAWDYARFGQQPSSQRSAPAPDHIYPMVFKSKFGGHNWPDSWTINGQSYPKTDTPTLERGRRYRLTFDNQSGDPHPVHLHRHTFELTRVNGVPTSGVFKDTVVVSPHRQVEVDFVADNPGLTLFHCHQQMHMDYGFMMVFRYVG